MGQTYVEDQKDSSEVCLPSSDRFPITPSVDQFGEGISPAFLGDLLLDFFHSPRVEGRVSEVSMARITYRTI